MQQPEHGQLSRAGRRGTGSWAPSCIRSILRNQRYRGVYVDGKIKKQRRAGIVLRVHADPSEGITLELPEWQIVDDATWTKAQEGFRTAAESTEPRHRLNGAPKHALSRIARCGTCDGYIGVTNGRVRRQTIKTYACGYHHKRGPAVCPVTIYQPMEEIDRALVTYVDRYVLTPEVIESMAKEVRLAIQSQLPKRHADASELERELRDVKAEQRRLTQAVAMAADVPELIAELRQRAARVKSLENQIANVRRAPADLRALVD